MSWEGKLLSQYNKIKIFQNNLFQGKNGSQTYFDLWFYCNASENDKSTGDTLDQWNIYILRIDIYRHVFMEVLRVPAPIQVSKKQTIKLVRWGMSWPSTNTLFKMSFCKPPVCQNIIFGWWKVVYLILLALNKLLCLRNCLLQFQPMSFSNCSKFASYFKTLQDHKNTLRTKCVPHCSLFLIQKQANCLAQFTCKA